MKLLSIDDSEVMRAVIANAGAVLGIETIGAESAEDLALLAKDASDIALILLDYNLTGMNGLECLRAIKANPRWNKIPVMMVTTESERAVIIKSIKGGAQNYLVKPFSNEDLVAKITQSLGKAL